MTASLKERVEVDAGKKSGGVYAVPLDMVYNEHQNVDQIATAYLQNSETSEEQGPQNQARQKLANGGKLKMHLSQTFAFLVK